MAEKQLIVVVEGTAALGPYWQTILSDYLEKIIRCFYGNELTGQKFSGETPELAMVVFCAHGPCSDFLVQRSGWTKDLDVFFRWLSGISFSGGGFSDVAIAEGLSEALLMFPITTNGSQPLQNFDTQKHCILIAASNPHSVPTPVYRPLIPSLEHNEKVEAQPETCLADAEAVAKSLGQCSVSLSVISPKPLLKLRGIYNAGKRISRAADPVVDHSKNPHFLVLISENFMEARAALSHPLAGNMTSNQNNIKVDVTSSGNLIPGPTSASISTVNGSVNRQAVSMGNIPTATVKVEPTILPSLGSGPAFSHMPPISMVPAQGVPSLQTSSPSPTSQEMNATSEGVQEMKPSVNTLSHSLRPTVPAAANVNILNHLSQHRQMISSASIAGASSIGLQTMAGTPMTMHMPNMISNGLSSSAVSGITSVSGSTMIMGNAHVAQNGTLSSFTSATPSLSGNSNNGIPPAMANLQSNISMGQSVPVMTQGSLASGAQIAQGGIGMNQNIMNSIGPGSISSGPGSMMPMPGMSQQAGLNSLGMSNNSTMNMPLTQHGPGFQQNQSKYVKIWEGALSGQRQGLPVFICKLEGYRSTTASETIAADWPQSMQIVRLIAQDHMNNKQYVGKADYLVFRTLNPHGFLGQLQEKKLCAVIQLPSQTLLLSVSDKAGRLIGMLFPGDMVVFKPQATSQQQQQMVLGSGMNQQQQQQHMGMSQQPQQMVGPGMGMSQQPQQMVGPGMGQQQMSQTYVQGPGRSQLMSQGKMSSHGPSAGFLPDGHH